MSAEETATLLATLQSELVGLKAETAIKVASLEDTITELAHENALLKRRLYGNKTERSHTSELQLALGDLLASEAQLQKDLDAAVEKAKGDAEPEPGQSEGHANGPSPKGVATGRHVAVNELPFCVCVVVMPVVRSRSSGASATRQAAQRRCSLRVRP